MCVVVVVVVVVVVSAIVKPQVLPPCMVEGRSRNPLYYYYSINTGSDVVH